MKSPPGWLGPAWFVALAVMGLASGARGQGFYYELETIATTGGLTSEGHTINSFRGTSVNESGTVALAAAVTGASLSLQGIHISGTGGVPVAVGPASDARTTTSVSITADGKIAAHEQATAGTPRPSAIRVWDSATPAVTPAPLITNTGAGVSVLLTPVSRANDGRVMFPATTPRRLYVNTAEVANQKTDLGVIAPNGQAWVASGGAYVLREGTGSSGTLSVDPLSGAKQVIATAGSAEWAELGSLPGISDSGKVVAFAGEPTFGDPGIFLWIDEPSNPDLAEPIRIMGFRDARGGLGYDDDDEPVIFDLFEMGQRVGVQHREAGPAGLEGDEILVCFIAKPATGSFTNPHTGFPMLFTEQPGLWVVNVTPSRDLTGTEPIRRDVKTSPMPVLQVGDFVDGAAVTGIFTEDPLAFAEKTPAGFTRVTIGPADHYLGFEIQMASGVRKVMRASQFDSDFDGLFDHWEEVGGGLDVNRDGTVDLVLHDFGADPYRKDAFFEIDWSAPWEPSPEVIATLEPPAAALQHLVDRFAAAPVPNPVGGPGITVHIDAGITRSINLPPTATRDGGDEMVDPLGAGVVTVIYSNDEDYTPLPPGETDSYGNPYVERSAKVMRDEYFGGLENNARELVFRHILIGVIVGESSMGDLWGLGEAPLYSSRPLTPEESFTNLDDDPAWFEGDVSRDDNGNGTHDPGEAFYDIKRLGQYDPAEPFVDANGNGVCDPARPESSRSMPGNSIIIGMQGRYDPAAGTSPVYFPLPGVPDRVPAPPSLFLLSTLYHEVGHLMTLLHGGSDEWTVNPLPAPKPDYRSIMNYRYGPYPAPDGSFVLDYSATAGPGTFNDWSIFRMDFARHFDVLGDQRLSDRYVVPGSPEVREAKRTMLDLETTFGPAGPPLPVLIAPYVPDPDLQDLDGDGFVRLVELAMGLDPAVADAFGVLLVEVDRSVNPPVLSLTFQRDTNRADLSLHAEYSGDLESWSAVGVQEENLSAAGNIQSVKASVAGDPVTGMGYLRLRATRN